MVLKVGTLGVVVERENNIITMYITNAACSRIYCEISLGTNEALKKVKFVVIAYNDHVMLLEGGGIMIVVDYDVERVAVNKDEIAVIGKGWGEDVRAPWDKAYNGMFGM